MTVSWHVVEKLLIVSDYQNKVFFYKTLSKKCFLSKPFSQCTCSADAVQLLFVYANWQFTIKCVILKSVLLFYILYFGWILFVIQILPQTLPLNWSDIKRSNWDVNDEVFLIILFLLCLDGNFRYITHFKLVYFVVY